MRTNDEGDRTMPLLQTARTDREFIEAAQAGELGEAYRDAANGAITTTQNFPGDWTDATIAETIRQDVAANCLVVENVCAPSALDDVLQVIRQKVKEYDAAGRWDDVTTRRDYKLIAAAPLVDAVEKLDTMLSAGQPLPTAWLENRRPEQAADVTEREGRRS
jgi:hypothetical protein